MKLLDRFKVRGTTHRKKGSGRHSILTGAKKLLIEEQMRADNETTAIQLHQMLKRNNVSVSLSTILRSRKALGWTFRGSAYCQLIRGANKVKRLDWAKENVGKDFPDVIWTDECSILKWSHTADTAVAKVGEPPKNKPR